MKNIWTKFLIICIAFHTPLICNAHNLNGHNDELKNILFGENKNKLSGRSIENFNLLCEAAYITLDFSSDSDLRDSGKRFLNHLKESGIKNVPSIDSITFGANQYHQKYTHYGWEKGYMGEIDRANWEARKKLLISTVEKIGDFNKNEQIKIDAFAALVYEFHILGDHIGDKDQTKYTRIRLVSEPDYRGQEVSPTSNGPFNNPTLYVYLLYHLQRLFRDQKNTYEYIQLIGFLNRHKDEYANYPQNQVPYENITFLAIKTRDELIRYLPKLLEREIFFKKAFY